MEFSSFLFLLLIATAAALVQGQGTRVGFYSRTCPQAESIVQKTVQSHFQSNPTIAPGLLRMHFHDCFVQGCNASILIDGSSIEKTAGPNRLLRGYDVIDDAKAQLEAACPGVVSCADILALAARDSVVLTKGLMWKMPTGRRDGRVSLASDVNNLPGPRDSVEVQKQKFADKGLNDQDLVTLVGGHTIGTSACQAFRYRLHNFSTTTANGADPSMDATFVTHLQALCPANGDASRRIALDTGSSDTFDASFFTNLKNGHGILESDQKVRGLRGLNFNVEFGRSMVKMSNIGVKTGTEGHGSKLRYRSLTRRVMRHISIGVSVRYQAIRKIR
ncbi:hypothetical protein PVL29_015826 [Vitis rotundifolia]|uniref:Peroxidase n=1 Tax=Vitis rotundifolia TaxID=103349 RepID=A0AA38ZDP5_VITRO|nr:hypothetical protein PVL29_015826 [Vitis rotundifolia]